MSDVDIRNDTGLTQEQIDEAIVVHAILEQCAENLWLYLTPVLRMCLRLEPQALTNLLKSGLHLPTADEPRDDPPGIGMEVSAQQSLGVELTPRVSDRYPRVEAVLLQTLPAGNSNSSSDSGFISMLYPGISGGM